MPFVRSSFDELTAPLIFPFFSFSFFPLEPLFMFFWGLGKDGWHVNFGAGWDFGSGGAKEGGGECKSA
jgi:hypothetical protein